MLELHTVEPMLWKQEREAADTLCCMQIQQVALFYEGGGGGVLNWMRFSVTKAETGRKCDAVTSHESTLFLPGLFGLWWSGRANCCWTPTEAAPRLFRCPLPSLSLVHQTRERAGTTAWR